MESERELDNMRWLVTSHSKLFLESVIIDFQLVSEPYDSASPCSALSRKKINQLRFKTFDCNDSKMIFMCEAVEVVDDYKKPTIEVKKKVLDVRETFFSYLGSYGKCQ